VGIFITGVIGNIAVCLVIVKNKSMHTATNYYLFSLAISDLMILVLGESALFGLILYNPLTMNDTDFMMLVLRKYTCSIRFESA
jgi:hypothetical protein